MRRCSPSRCGRHRRSRCTRAAVLASCSRHVHAAGALRDPPRTRGDARGVDGGERGHRHDGGARHLGGSCDQRSAHRRDRTRWGRRRDDRIHGGGNPPGRRSAAASGRGACIRGGRGLVPEGRGQRGYGELRTEPGAALLLGVGESTASSSACWTSSTRSSRSRSWRSGARARASSLPRSAWAASWAPPSPSRSRAVAGCRRRSPEVWPRAASRWPRWGSPGTWPWRLPSDRRGRRRPCVLRRRGANAAATSREGRRPGTRIRGGGGPADARAGGRLGGRPGPRLRVRPARRVRRGRRVTGGGRAGDVAPYPAGGRACVRAPGPSW